MENPEEILHSLEEFSKMKPKDIPRELEEYLCFVAKTGNPVYQWPTIKSLFREKLLTVITEFYESCPSVEIPPCPNVEMFNYDLMKNFILEKLDTFAAAPFTVQRICELLTTPRKEYNRIDKYMRALEKNILVVSTTEPGRRSTENGESIVNGLESEHLPETSNSSHDINVEEMDESPSWPRTGQIAPVLFETTSENQSTDVQQDLEQHPFQSGSEVKIHEIASSISITTKSEEDNPPETIISCQSIDEPQQPYVLIEPVVSNSCVATSQAVDENETDTSLSITTLPAGVQQRRSSMERVESSENKSVEVEVHENKETSSPEDDPQKLSDEKEEVQPLAETIISNPICPEPVDEHIGAELEKNLEEITLVKDQSDIEDISPESSSQSMETLQLDVNQERCRDQLDIIEKLDEKNQDISQTEQNEIPVKDDKSDAKEEPLTCVLTDTSCLQASEEEEPILKAFTCTEPDLKLPSSSLQISDQLREVEAKSEASTENNFSNIPGLKVQEAEPEPDVSIRQEDCKMQTSMDVDVLSEIKADEKEEHISEEPSSTSDAL